MKRVLFVVALAASLSACATTGTVAGDRPTVSATIATAVERAAEAWQVVRQVAVLWLPRLSTERQAQVQHYLAVGDQAIATAQVAETAADALAALQHASAATDGVTAAVAQ